MTTESGGRPPANRTTARLTPYELVFTEGDFESRAFPRIDTEVAETGLDPLSPHGFHFLTTAAELVREVTPEDAPAEALEQYRGLLFHAYHFWREGRKLLVVPPATARFVVEAATDLDGFSLPVEPRAGYAQLPANLFWGSISPDSTPEPLDGFFYTRASGADRLGAPVEYLDLLLVLGIRRARAGFSVIRLDAGLRDTLPEVLASGTREGGDFASHLPGGDISGLYSILTTTEAIKLAARVLWFTQRFGDLAVEVEAPEPRRSAADPPPTRLPYVLLRLATDAAAPDRDDGG